MRDEERKTAGHIEQLQYQLNSCTQEARADKDENTVLRKDKRNLERSNEKLSRQNAELSAQKNSLLQEIEKLKNDATYLRQINLDGKKLNDDLLQEQTNQRRNIQSLHRDNEQLRTHIAKMNADVNPNHEEEYYVQSLQELNSEVEMWIAKNAKANAAQSLSGLEETKILEVLALSGPCGKTSSEFLNKNRAFRMLYSSPRSRIPLLRHIVGTYLFDAIFQPFSAGLPSAVSQVLESVEEELIVRGQSLMERADFENPRRPKY